MEGLSRSSRADSGDVVQALELFAKYRLSQNDK
jgi:hypothetical protein